MRWLVAIAVAVAASAFIPAGVATADAFEAPKTLGWFAVLLATAAFGMRAKGARIGGRASWFAAALLAWMALRCGIWRDWCTLAGWMLPPALFLAGQVLDNAARRKIAFACVAVGAFQLVLSLAQRLGLDPLFGATTSGLGHAPGRMIGTVGYHNQAVDLLAVAGGVAIAVFAKSKRSRAAIVLALASAASLAAYRAGMAGVAAGALSMLATEWTVARKIGARHSLRPLAAGVAAALLAGAAVAIALPETRARLADVVRRPLETPALRTRATMARAAFAMICERPMTGHGSGSYAFQYMERVATTLPDDIRHRDLQRVVYAREPHNDYLHLWCEFGLVGFVLAVAWFACAVRRTVPEMAFAVGYWLVASCFGFPWHDTAAGPMFGLALCICGSDEGQSFASGIPRRVACGFLAIMGAVGMALSVLQVHVDAGRTEPREWQSRSLARAGGLAALSGRLERAESMLEKSLAAERSPEQYNNIGYVKMKLGQPAEAEQYYRALAATGIGYAKALTSLAVALEAQGKWGEAADTLRRRHALWPDASSDADVFRMAALYLRAGDAKRARKVAESFCRRNRMRGKWTAEWENLLGAALLQDGHAVEASVHFQKALRINPGLVSARKNLELATTSNAGEATHGVECK